jgi:phospholipid N-methyltransferase
MKEIIYKGNELDFFKNATNWKSYFSNKISPYINGDILEVGAGIGANTKYLIHNNTRVSSITCLEPDTQLCLEIKNTHIKDKVITREVINGTILNIHKLYDTIIYIDVLEHIEHSKEEIELIKMRLKENGQLIILVPAFNFLFSEFDAKIGHYRRYNKRILKNEVNNKLLLKKVFYLDSLGVFVSLINKLFLKKSNPTFSNVNFWDKIIIPLSKFFDYIFLFKFGKSLIGIYQKK